MLTERRELFNTYMKTLAHIESLNGLMPAFAELLREEASREAFNRKLAEFDEIRFEGRVPGLDPIWLKNVSISSFTHVEYIVMDKLRHRITFDEIFSKEFLSLLLLINSSVFFLIATENRFVCRDQALAQMSSARIKTIFQRNVRHQMRKMRRYAFSEKIHYKAIRLLGAFFKAPSPLSKHLDMSFLKNYDNPNPLDRIGGLTSGMTSPRSQKGQWPRCPRSSSCSRASWPPTSRSSTTRPTTACPS